MRKRGDASHWHGACLATETIEGAALALEGVDDIHGSDGFSAGVLGVGHGVTDHVLEEDFEDTAGLFVDEAGNALDATTACKTTDSGLGDALDVVTQHLAVALGAALAESFSSFAASRHCCLICASLATQGRVQIRKTRSNPRPADLPVLIG